MFYEPLKFAILLWLRTGETKFSPSTSLQSKLLGRELDRFFVSSLTYFGGKELQHIQWQSAATFVTKIQNVEGSIPDVWTDESCASFGFNTNRIVVITTSRVYNMNDIFQKGQYQVIAVKMSTINWNMLVRTGFQPQWYSGGVPYPNALQGTIEENKG